MFRFATCQPDLEKWLKTDIARIRPAWKVAFMRPGLITFKVPANAEPRVPSLFARRSGVSIGRFDTIEEARTAVAQYAVIHEFPRDLEADTARIGRPAASGQRVADLITAPGEPVFAGWHTQNDGESPFPGGDWPIEVPADSPSRGFAKIEQAIAWAHVPIRAGQVAVEVGASPGGAALALLRRGVSVVGVDPEPMAPVVLAGTDKAAFHHLRVPIGKLRLEDLPKKVDWFLCDINLAPPVVLHGLIRLMTHLQPRLQGAVITLQLNDNGLIPTIPRLLQRVSDFGFANVRATHLPANRREICVVARP